jgi:hypothetical protein
MGQATTDWNLSKFETFAEGTKPNFMKTYNEEDL